MFEYVVWVFECACVLGGAFMLTRAFQHQVAKDVEACCTSMLSFPVAPHMLSSEVNQFHDQGCLFLLRPTCCLVK